MQPMHIHVVPLPGHRWTQSMESFAKTVSDWPGMYFEMDGSFVWVRGSNSDASRSQIDGMLYDRNESIEYFDLKGTATKDSWLELFNAILGKTSKTCNLDELDENLRVHTVSRGEYKSVRQFIQTIDGI
jgi:hypothetical protein